MVWLTSHSYIICLIADKEFIEKLSICLISFRYNLIHLYVSIFVCSVAFYRVHVYDCMMFLSRSGAFNAHRNVTISGVGLQNLGLCSASSTASEREGSLSCHSCVIVWHQPTYTVSFECPAHI